MISKRLLTSVLLIVGLCGPLNAAKMDSLGIEVKEGKTYVLHRVESQETLYGLSRRYHTSVETIKSYNKINGESLSLGVVLRIPWNSGIVHHVKPGETLYTLSKVYGVSISDLRSWNQLDSNDLEADQTLFIGTPVKAIGPTLTSQTITTVENSGSVHVVEASETLYAIAVKYGVSVEDLKTWNGLKDHEVHIGDRLTVKKPSGSSISSGVGQTSQSSIPSMVAMEEVPEEEELREEEAPVVEKVEPSRNARHNTPLKTVKEHGVAAVFEGDDTKKYLALHRTAPVGTIMQVRNEMTNLTVFVRVVGKLPDTGDNNNVLLRLSRAAQTGLGALDSRFRVELSYMPAQ